MSMSVLWFLRIHLIYRHFILIFFTAAFALPGSLFADGTDPLIIGSDADKQIVATFEGIKRDHAGRFEVFQIDLKNLTDRDFDLYYEPRTFDRGLLLVIDPANFTGQLHEGLATVFTEGFVREHNRPPADSLVRLEAGGTLEFNLYFSDFVKVDELAGPEFVRVQAVGMVYFFDKGVTPDTGTAIGAVSIMHVIDRIALTELPQS